MDSFIDVRGEATIDELVLEYRADLTVTVRAPQADTALSEVEDLRNLCIRRLREGGLTEAELKEGAGEVWRPWFWRKKAGQEVSRKVLISCDDVNRLFRALGSLEPIFSNQRFSMAVTMRPPRFGASPEAHAAAQAAAVGDARRKAEAVAASSKVALGRVVQVEEIDERVGRSGAYGDEEWRTFGIAAAGAAAAEEPPEILEGATRTRTVRYRVRFSMESG